MEHVNQNFINTILSLALPWSQISQNIEKAGSQFKNCCKTVASNHRISLLLITLNLFHQGDGVKLLNVIPCSYNAVPLRAILWKQFELYFMKWIVLFYFTWRGQKKKKREREGEKKAPSLPCTGKLERPDLYLYV